MSYFVSHLAPIGALTLQHLRLVASALLLALAVALPLGVLAARVRSAAVPIFGAMGMFYTIPSLALLALAVQYIGLGFWPVVLVLAAYAQFILVRSIAAALQNVPQSEREAARGLGMNAAQQLLQVEIPLAMPVLLGGVRLAVVALIAIATLGGYVGAGGLGSYIFLGLQRQYIDQTLAGSIPAALLALLCDAALRAAERIAANRTR